MTDAENKQRQAIRLHHQSSQNALDMLKTVKDNSDLLKWISENIVIVKISLQQSAKPPEIW